VDQSDFGAFQACFSGANVLAPASCVVPPPQGSFSRYCESTPVVIADNTNGSRPQRITIRNSGDCDITISVSTGESIVIKPKDTGSIRVPVGATATRTCSSTGGTICAGTQSVGGEEDSAQGTFSLYCGGPAVIIEDNRQGSRVSRLTVQNTGDCEITTTVSTGGAITIKPHDAGTINVPVGATATRTCSSTSGLICAGSVTTSGK